MANVVPPTGQAAYFSKLSLFTEYGTLDQNLAHLAGITAAMLDAENCSIMLIEGDGQTDDRLVVCANVGHLSAAAYRESAVKNQGVAGHVLATGIALRVDDISNSIFHECARHPADPRRSLMCAAIHIQSKMVGVINVSGRKAKGPFQESHLQLLEVIGLFVGKSIQVSQLQSMLDSRFAQMAVLQEAANKIGSSLAAGLPNPDQVAKIMAKSFYKEMTRAGFGSRQIINAASELITQLSGNLNRHSKRLGKDYQRDSHEPCPVIEPPN
jgi:L-methionine (R)-S-oxide reductase